jgi:hypothetical protein
MIWQDEIQCFGRGFQAWHMNELLMKLSGQAK